MLLLATHETGTCIRIPVSVLKVLLSVLVALVPNWVEVETDTDDWPASRADSSGRFVGAGDGALAGVSSVAEVRASLAVSCARLLSRDWGSGFGVWGLRFGF